MKTIELEDDVYQHLLRNTHRIGESASDILRRLLNLAQPSGNGGRQPHQKASALTESTKGVSVLDAEVSEFLSDPRFRGQPEVLGKFLFVLSRVHGRDPKRFDVVLTLCGRRRKYFAKSSAELEQSGNSVFPKRIPDSPFWVVTNNDTPKKQRMVAGVLRLLGYSESAINQVVEALA